MVSYLQLQYLALFHCIHQSHKTFSQCHWFIIYYNICLKYINWFNKGFKKCNQWPQPEYACNNTTVPSALVLLLLVLPLLVPPCAARYFLSVVACQQCCDHVRREMWCVLSSGRQLLIRETAQRQHDNMPHMFMTRLYPTHYDLKGQKSRGRAQTWQPHYWLETFCLLVNT